MSKTRRIEFLERLVNLLQEYNAEIEIYTEENIVLDGRISLVVKVHDKQVYDAWGLEFNGNDLEDYVKQVKDAGEYV